MPRTFLSRALLLSSPSSSPFSLLLSLATCPAFPQLLHIDPLRSSSTLVNIVPIITFRLAAIDIIHRQKNLCLFLSSSILRLEVFVFLADIVRPHHDLLLHVCRTSVQRGRQSPHVWDLRIFSKFRPSWYSTFLSTEESSVSPDSRLLPV